MLTGSAGAGRCPRWDLSRVSRAPESGGDGAQGWCAGSARWRRLRARGLAAPGCVTTERNARGSTGHTSVPAQTVPRRDGTGPGWRGLPLAVPLAGLVQPQQVSRKRQTGGSWLAAAAGPLCERNGGFVKEAGEQACLRPHRASPRGFGLIFKALWYRSRAFWKLPELQKLSELLLGKVSEPLLGANRRRAPGAGLVQPIRPEPLNSPCAAAPQPALRA